jgi:hypothetical protein
MLGGEALDRRDVQVVVVIVRDQHDVDRRQILERQAGPRDPARAGERQRARALRPVGIGQDVHAVELEQQRRMAHQVTVAAPRLSRIAGRSLATDGKLAVRAG